MNPSQKRRIKKSEENPRVIRPIQTHKNMDAFMSLTVRIRANLHMTQKTTPNDPMCEVGKDKCQINKIKLTVLNVNVTYYLVL